MPPEDTRAATVVGLGDSSAARSPKAALRIQTLENELLGSGNSPSDNGAPEFKDLGPLDQNEADCDQIIKDKRDTPRWKLGHPLCIEFPRELLGRAAVSGGRKKRDPNGSAPVLSELNDIVSHFVQLVVDRDKDQTIFKSGRHRSIRVGTMCSGTDSPIFVLEEICRQLNSRGFPITLHHEFSCEVEPFKQAFIHRNTSGQATIFRDVVEMGDPDHHEAYANPIHRWWSMMQALLIMLILMLRPTAFSSTVSIPQRIDILVAGTSCTEFSKLNIDPKTTLMGGTFKEVMKQLSKMADDGKAPEQISDAWNQWVGACINTINKEKTGESHRTFFGMLGYIRKYKPPIIILENVYGAPWCEIGQHLRFEKYAVAWGWYDSKSYYIPQTRCRGYLAAFSAEKFGVEPAFEAARHWNASMTDMQHEPTSNVLSFLFDPSDPVVQSARSEFQVGQSRKIADVNWIDSEVRHIIARRIHKLTDARPYTHWSSDGFRLLRDTCWHDFLKPQVHRVQDLLEINWACGKLHNLDNTDYRYKAKIFDLSQNVERMSGAASFGQIGCITPKGMPYLMGQSRPILGLEALRLQGLPYYELVLGNETQDQLRDLAGNAMTTTIVGCAMMSALTCVARATSQPFGFPPDEGSAIAGDRIYQIGDITSEEVFHQTNLVECGADASDEKTLYALTRSYCSCAKSAAYSRYSELLKCEKCGIMRCAGCLGNPPHRFVPFLEAHEVMGAHQAVLHLQRSLPHKLQFSPLDETHVTFQNLSRRDLHASLGAFLSSTLYLKKVHLSEVVTAVYASTAGELSVVLTKHGFFLYARLTAQKSDGEETEILGTHSVPFFARTVKPLSLTDLRHPDKSQPSNLA